MKPIEYKPGYSFKYFQGVPKRLEQILNEYFNTDKYLIKDVLKISTTEIIIIYKEKEPHK